MQNSFHNYLALITELQKTVNQGVYRVYELKGRLEVKHSDLDRKAIELSIATEIELEARNIKLELNKIGTELSDLTNKIK